AFVRSMLFSQADDGIRDRSVTGVQTCALPISISLVATLDGLLSGLMGGMIGAMLGEMITAEYQDAIVKIMFFLFLGTLLILVKKIGRASCRERVYLSVRRA